MSSTDLLPSNTGPVTEQERIASIDVLRGFAILGILIMNIQSFSMIDAAYMNPTAYGDLNGANYVVWVVGHVVADQKFMTIFSMLFGAGIVLMTSRREASGQYTAGVHYRRMAILLGFGLLHAYLLWYGDILFAYAMSGFLIYLARHWRARSLITVGLLTVAVGAGIWTLLGLSIPYWPEKAIEGFVDSWAPSAETIAVQLDTYRGGWLHQMPHRALTSIAVQTFMLALHVFWRAGGLMLIGMGLFKLGVFSARRSTAEYLVMIAVGLGAGIPIILLGVQSNFAAGWDMQYSLFRGSQYNYWGSLLVSLGWVGTVMLVCRTGAITAITKPLASVGRMALTNYLLQTIICTTLFYGHGFGLFGKVERTGQAGITIAIWVTLIVVSAVWLRYYRFGPFEWLWRTLTYGQAQPMRRR